MNCSICLENILKKDEIMHEAINILEKRGHKVEMFESKQEALAKTYNIEYYPVVVAMERLFLKHIKNI